MSENNVEAGLSETAYGLVEIKADGKKLIYLTRVKYNPETGQTGNLQLEEMKTSKAGSINKFIVTTAKELFKKLVTGDE